MAVSNAEGIKEWRAAKDAAEGVAVAEALRVSLQELVAAGEMSEGAYLDACACGLDEIRELAGSDPEVHARRAKRLLNALVSSNLGLVRKVAKRTLGARAGIAANLEEAQQEGAMGLVRAIECFDETRGSFSTCAGYWIRHYVQTCMQRQVDFAKQRPAMMPKEVAKSVNRFRLMHGREPEPAEIGIDPVLWAKWIDTVYVSSVEEMSNPDPMGTARGGSSTGQAIKGSDELIVDPDENPENVVSTVNLHDKLGEVIAEMSPRNREIMRAVFLEGSGIPEVAERFGLTMQRVHQLKGTLEKRLRKVLAA